MKFIILKKIIFIIFFLLTASPICFAQTNHKPSQIPGRRTEQAIKSTPAFAEILLRKTELESVLEDLSVSYTEDFPKVKETRYELSLIEKDIAKVLSSEGSDLTRLTLALGKLMVRRAELGTNLWSLQTRLSEDHPDVKRAKRRVSSFDKAISEILP